MFSTFFTSEQSSAVITELPTPKSISEYEELGENLFQDAVFLCNGGEKEGWTVIVEKEGVIAYELPSRQKGAAVCVKSVASMPRSAKVNRALNNKRLNPNRTKTVHLQ